MNDNENLKSLYNTLQKEGYTPPVFEQFAKDMEDDSNLRGVYSTLQNEGYTPPDYDTFRSDMGLGKVAKTNPKVKVGSHAQMVVDEYDRAAKAAGTELTSNNEKSDSEAINEANEPNRTDNPSKTNEPVTPRMQFVPEAENVIMATPTAETLKKYPWLKADEAVPFDRNTGEPLYTWVDEQGNPILQRDLDVRRAKEEITGEKEYMQKTPASLQLPGGTTRGVRLDGSISGYVDNMMKQQYGDDYLNGQYTTKDGRLVSGAEYLNEKAQETYNELNEELRTARIDMLLSDDEEQKKQLVNNLSKKWKGVISEQSLSEALNDEETAREDLVAMAGDEIEKARADERRIMAEMNRRGSELDSQTSPFADQTFNVRGVDSEYRFLTAELNAVQDRIKSWEAVRDSKDIGLLRGLANTAGNIRTWDLGMSDFNTGLALLTSRGEKRQELVNLLGGAQRAASIEDQTTNNIYRWAKIAGESLPFAATFMATGGGFANIGKAAGNRALRIAERRAIDGLAKNVVKNMGVGLGEVASSYLLATTAQGLGTAGDIMRRRTGEIQQGSDGKYDLVNGNSWGEAIYKGATAAAIENYTEMLGAHINIGKNVMNFLPKIGMGRVSDWFLKAGKQNWYNTTKEWLSRMGVNGYGGEVLEEEIAIPLNAILVGDNPLLFGSGGLLDKDTQIDILGGMALSIAGMNAGTLAAYGAQRGAYAAMTANDERLLNNADATALEVLGNKWNAIKDDIDNTPNEAMPTLIKEYADDETMSKEEKEAVGGYITSLLRSRGHNLGQNAVMQADEEEQTMLDNNLTPEEQQNVHEDGMIHTALLYPTADNGGGPQEVFITKGNVVMRGDGTIDTEASSNAIYYKGSDGQVHMTSPDKIQSVNEPISIEEYAAAGEKNEPNMPNELNTTEGFAVGDEVNVNIDDEQAAGEITGITEDGLLIVSYETPDGTISSIRISPDELRNMNRPNDEQPPMGGAGAVVEEPAVEIGNNEPQNIPENGNIELQNIPIEEDGTQNIESAGNDAEEIIPTDEDGNPRYYDAPVEATIADLYDGSLDDTEVQGFIDANINEAQKKYDNVQKKAPKIGTNKAKYLEQKRKWQADVDEAKRVLDYWNEVNAQKESITHTTPQEIEAAQAELSGQNAREEYAAMNENVPTNAVAVASDFIRGAKITPESFKAETGYRAGEQRRFVGMIATEQNGGKSIDRLAEELVSYDNAELNGITFNGDTSVAKDAILEALQGAGTRGELAVDNTAEQEQYVNARRAELDAQYMEAYGMTYEDYLAYEEQKLPEMLRKYANFDEVEYYNLYADEIERRLNASINEQGNDTAGEEPRIGGGNEVLHKQGTYNAGGSESGKEQRGEIPTGVQSTVEDGAVSERTSKSSQRSGNVPERIEGVKETTEGLTKEDADNLLSAMEERAEFAPEIELTPANWEEQFGNDGMVDTPIGKVKMGENQIAKLFTKGRSSQFGMIRPTLTEPDVVVEVPSSLTEETNNDVERPTSLLFIKVFLKNDGSKVYYFKSVTVKKDGLEVSVSSHLDRKKRVEDALIKGKLLYRFDGGAQTEHRPADVSVTTPLAGQGASSKGNATIGDQSVSDMENGTLVSPQLASSESKDTQTSANEQTVGEKIAQEEAKVEQNPTEAQKEAGNYKKGHVKIDGYDVTIENPKGSVRSGVDRNGQEWSVTMNNTYGYIRGTEGVDGDHIDVFLSDDPTQGDVYVIDQVNENGSFDEHKVMYGFNSVEEARDAYLANYSPGWQGLGTITEVSKEEFKKWINSSHRKTKPFAEYKSVNKDGAQNEPNVPRPIEGESPVDYARRLGESKSENKAQEQKGKAGKDLPLTETEYANMRMKELMEGNPQLDEDDAENQALDEYPSYIGEKIKSGELENLYAELSINGQIKLSHIVESAGFDVSDISGKANKERQDEKKRNIHNVGEHITIEFNDGTLVTGEIIKAENGKITVLSDENKRKYTVPEKSIINTDNEANGNIRFRFIGEQGAARLDATEEATTRLDNLATARLMEQAYNDKKARIDKLRDSKTVEITGEEIEPSDDLKQYKKNALEYGKKLQGNYVNKDTGITIQLQRGRRNGGINEVLQHDYKDVEHLQSVAAIPQIIENSIYIDSRENTDKEKNPNVAEYQYYVCGLKIGNTDYTVRSTIAVDNKGNRYYDHKLTSIEKGKLLDQINGQTAKNVGFGTTPGTKPTTDNGEVLNPEIQKSGNTSDYKDKRLISLLQTNDQENARKIKLATGWERGADGKWRYETPDFEYHPNGDARQNDKYKESDWYKELYDLEERLFNGETLTDEETKRFDELAARENEIRDNEKNTERIYLDDYVKDDELFNAYPELKQTRVDFVDLPNEEYSAKYNSEENRITVNQAKSMDVKSVLAHEIQHAIQRIEGFASGSNTDSYRNAATSENVIADINAATGGRLVESGGFNNTPEGIFDALNRKTMYGTILRDNSTELDEVARKYGYETIFDLVNDIGKFKSSVEMYRSEAGEVEARNVQERLNMTPEQRRNTLAEETEDVAREDQQFLQDAIGTGESLASTVQPDDIDTAVADTANKLNIGVRVAHSVDEVGDEGVRRAIEKGRNVKGWYDTRTGEIVVYAPNATDADDAVRTVLHEGVAHYGLRQLVGDENFDTFLDNIYNNVDEGIKAAIDEKAQRNGWSTRVATEEYLASLAEDTNFEAARSSGLWQRIKDFFMDLLTKAGIRLNEALTDNELRYILWRSYENLQEPNGRGTIGTVRDVAMQGRLGVGNYGNEDMRLRETEDEQTPEKKSENKYRELYDKRVSRRRARLNRSYFDSMQPVKVLQKTITEETGQQIRPEENVYLQENRANSMAQRKHEMWERGHMEPARREVTKLMQQIMGGNWLTRRFKLPKTRRNAYNAVVRYMKSKHGLENNEYRRNMEAEAAREPFEAEIGAVEKLVKDGNISRAEADKRQAELKEQADKAETESRAKTLNKDYSGLQGIYGKDFERKAKEYVEDFEGAYDTAPLWREWSGATKAILEEEYKSGLLSKELYDRIRNMYKYYIPLKGWAENRAEDVYTYYATGSGDGGKPHRREGRTSESDDPLVTLEQDADRQFTAAARNRTKQALYNLATAHKSSLLTVRRQWYQNIGTKENPDWQRKDPEIPENATPEQMEQIIKDFEKDMRKLEKEGTAMRQKKPMILPYHATKSMEKEHTVRVMVNGKEYVIYVNGNPAAAQAVNGTSTPQDPDGSVLKRIYGALRWINRVKASLLTAVNVNFIPSNLVRDAQYSIQNMKAKEPVDYVLKYVKNLGEGMAKMTSARLFYKDKKGTLNMDDKTERLFKEFLDNGGETGYTARYTLEKQRRRNMAAINRMTGIDWLAGLRMLQHSLEYVNRSVETIVRFAAYKTSREAGRSIAQSINDAKEASVNFDKHGSGELGNKEWRLAYIFSNVGFQALRRLLENASGHPVRFTLAQIERFALGFAVPMMAKALLDSDGDDDEKDAYEALPEWMRESGLAVPVSPILRKVGADDAADKVKRVFLYLPLGPEDKIWYALGENTWHLFNKDNITEEEAMDMAVKFGSLAADLLPLDFQGYGGNPIVSLAPTAVQDFVALKENVNYWGQPIYRESTNYNEHDPGHRLAFTGTPEWYVERAEDINRLTGGDEYTKGWLSPKPEQIEYFINQTGGGVTRVVNQVMSLIERAGEDGNKDIQVLKNVPVVSSLVKKADVQDGKDGFDREKYYDYIDEYEKALHDYNAYRKAKRNGDDEAGQKAEKLKESPTGERMDIIRKDIRKIRNKDKHVRRIDEKENPTAEEEARRDKLKTESNELKQKLLEKLDKVKEKPGKQ